MISFIYRNILLFVKDRVALVFSFLAVFVVYFLYLCFLKDAMLKDLQPQFLNLAQEICNTWVIAGTVGILTLTSSLSILGILISDRSKQLLTDFQLTHLSPWKLTLGYILSTSILTFFISLVALAIGEGYIVYHGGSVLNTMQVIQVCGVLLLSILACTSFLFCFLIWFKSTSAFSNITTIVGTLSGFLMGIYLPIGVLPIFLQNTIRGFLFSHGTAMLRQIMMKDVLTQAFPIDNAAKEAFELHFGLYFQYGDITFQAGLSILLLIITTIICIGIAHSCMRYILHHN